ncbi:MAG: CHAD domain-containing protein [Actinomycetota bacterium]
MNGTGSIAANESNRMNGAGTQHKYKPAPVTQVLEPPEWIKLRNLTARSLRKFISLLPQISAADNSVSIHKVRALSRRAELMLDLYYAKPSPRLAHKLRRRIKSCRRLLGKLSDHDALLAITTQSMAAASPLQKPAWKSMKEYLADHRAKIAPEILREVSDLDIPSFAARLNQEFSNGEEYWRGVLSDHASHQGREMVASRLRHALSHLWRQFDSAVDESRQDPCERSIHEVRIAVKRLRNLVAVMAKLKVSGSSTHLFWLRSVQRSIGEWHDLEVLEHMMTGLLLRRKFLRDHLELAVQVEQLLLQNREIKKSSEEGFVRMTRQSGEYEQMKLWVKQVMVAVDSAASSAAVELPAALKKSA